MTSMEAYREAAKLAVPAVESALQDAYGGALRDTPTLAHNVASDAVYALWQHGWRPA